MVRLAILSIRASHGNRDGHTSGRNYVANVMDWLRDKTTCRMKFIYNIKMGDNRTKEGTELFLTLCEDHNNPIARKDA